MNSKSNIFYIGNQFILFTAPLSQTTTVSSITTELFPSPFTSPSNISTGNDPRSNSNVGSTNVVVLQIQLTCVLLSYYFLMIAALINGKRLANTFRLWRELLTECDNEVAGCGLKRRLQCYGSGYVIGFVCVYFVPRIRASIVWLTRFFPDMPSLESVLLVITTQLHLYILDY
jgi:hypothetical protein